MTPEEFDKLNQNYPYLTYVKFINDDIIGIIQNMDKQLISVYVYNDISDEALKWQFLELGKLWWENSNLLIPINIFLREDFVIFKNILKCLPRKDVKQLLGPTMNLEANFQKRIKRKKIQLVRNIED